MYRTPDGAARPFGLAASLVLVFMMLFTSMAARIGVLNEVSARFSRATTLPARRRWNP